MTTTKQHNYKGTNYHAVTVKTICNQPLRGAKNEMTHDVKWGKLDQWLKENKNEVIRITNHEYAN